MTTQVVEGIGAANSASARLRATATNPVPAMPYNHRSMVERRHPLRPESRARRHPQGEQALPCFDDRLRQVLARFPGVVLAVLFGSIASGRQRPGSDLDIALAADRALSAAERIAMIEALAECTGRAVDLIDLNVVAEPLLGQIVRHGRRLLGSDSAYGQLISRHLFEQADFMPYRSRVLAERRAAWTGK